VTAFKMQNQSGYQQSPRVVGPSRSQYDPNSNMSRVEHQFLTRMPDINSVESDLMKLLNDFSNSRLKKYGNNEIHENLFKKMDAVRDKQEKIAKIHFEQDSRLTAAKFVFCSCTFSFILIYRLLFCFSKNRW